MEHSAQELFDILNDTDECPFIEAKGLGDSTTSIMETVCSYSNEPGLGGGYILMSVSANDAEGNRYKVEAIPDMDKLQSDLATQCASMFNIAVRPKMTIERIGEIPVLKIWVDELPVGQKPLFFKKDKLPFGALRRIGSTDQHCNEDDLRVFYQDTNSYDQTPMKGTSFSDVDENAIERYRALREKVNPAAEELTYSDEELLASLGCVNRESPLELNLAGLILFGSPKAQRSHLPMLRVDYIRVPGNTWIENPDNRFTTIDMRGPLILLLYRLLDAINADLPKGFLLLEDSVQATSTGLPTKALREAIVNALMHRSYREHRPTQIVRYDNRLEIINPGFSLKSEDRLGQPGSETRNPFIAAVFHDTNLAETKGSGIRSMRRLMEASHLSPPTFESSRPENQFTARLLLHHFLGEEDMLWLSRFAGLELSDIQKQALIFTREVGAIDNQTYRQMADCDVLKASSDLRYLKSLSLLDSKGKGRSTYYVGGSGLEGSSIDTSLKIKESNSGALITEKNQQLTSGLPHEAIPSLFEDLNSPAQELSPPLTSLSTPPLDLNTPPPGLSTPPPGLSTPPPGPDPSSLNTLINEIESLGKRVNDPNVLKGLILRICYIRPFKSTELAAILGKREDYLKRKFLRELIHNRELKYLYPEMINHPEQAYITNNNNPTWQSTST